MTISMVATMFDGESHLSTRLLLQMFLPACFGTQRRQVFNMFAARAACRHPMLCSEAR
jgi:hypothetical protein